MGKAILLNVNGRQVKTVDVTYDDLIWLYKDFEKRYGRLPTTNDGKAKYNMPQQRIIKRILEENNVTYNDFMNSLGKVKHVRTDNDNYDFYVERYKLLSNKRNSYITSSELVNNPFGLPSAKWFIERCPNSNVRNFASFVRWCGLIPKIQDKEHVSKKLIEYEKELGRPITTSDITTGKIGFSMIVINRIWGTLDKCKSDLNLMKSYPRQSLPFSYYKKVLDDTLNNIINDDIGRNFISWKDIENPKYNPERVEHKTLTKSFKREGVDIFAYIKSNGFLMNPSNFSFHYTFDDGERVVSSMEYDFSRFLKEEIGLTYNVDYNRDVMYRKITNEINKGRSNCDYEFVLNGRNFYVEIAGIIDNINEGWELRKYSSKQEQNYQSKLLRKKEILERNNKNFLFLFKDDFVNNEYKNKLKNFIKIEYSEEVA